MGRTCGNLPDDPVRPLVSALGEGPGPLERPSGWAHDPVMPDAETAIRSRRKLTNRLIAAHDAERLRAHLTEDVLLIVGEGDLIQGADGVVAAFASQFADASFIAYDRTTETVEIAADGHRAAESGRGGGRWRGGLEVRGVYMAAWRERRGQWQLERELYVTLQR